LLFWFSVDWQQDRKGPRSDHAESERPKAAGLRGGAVGQVAGSGLEEGAEVAG